MPITNLESSPLKFKSLKNQEQDAPTASYGRYGLYRALMAESTPRIHIDDPIQSALDREQGLKRKPRF